MNWMKQKEHDEYTHKVYNSDGVLKKEVIIPAYHKHVQPHMPKELATKKRKYRVGKYGKRRYLTGLI